jgi:hypothetical protein
MQQGPAILLILLLLLLLLVVLHLLCRVLLDHAPRMPA